MHLRGQLLVALVILFILVAGIVMLSLFIGAVTLGMQEAMEETTAAKQRALLAKLKAKAKSSQAQFTDNSSTANRVVRLWTGEVIEEDEDDAAEAPLPRLLSPPGIFWRSDPAALRKCNRCY